MQIAKIKEKTAALIAKYKLGTEDTRNEIVELNKPLIWYAINKYGPRQVNKDDLYSDALFAFSKAIDKFDLGKGILFAPYAFQAMINEFFMDARKYKRRPKEVSIETPIYESKDGQTVTIADTLIAPSEQFIDHDYANKVIKKAFEKFSQRDQSIISDYLKDEPTQLILSKKYNLAQSYVSRIIKKFFKLIEKLSQIREQIEMDKPIMTVIDYVGYKNKGLTDKDIAERLNHNIKSVQNFHYRHRPEIDKLLKNQPKVAEKEVKTVKNEVNGQVENKCYISEDNYKAVVVKRDQLNRQVQALMLDIDEKQKLINEIEDENKTYKESYAANQDELEAAYGKNRAITDENDQLKQKIEAMAQEIADVRQTKNDAFSQVDLMQCKLEAQTGRLKAAEAYIVAVLDPDQ